MKKINEILKIQELKELNNAVYCKIHQCKLKIIREEYGIGIYYCPKCRKEYTELSDLSTIKLRTKEKIIYCDTCKKRFIFYKLKPEIAERIKKGTRALCNSCYQINERVSNPNMILDCYILLGRRWNCIFHLLDKGASPKDIYNYIGDYWQFCYHCNHITKFNNNYMNCKICPIDKKICASHYSERWGGIVRSFQYLYRMSKKRLYSSYEREIAFYSIGKILELILKNINETLSEYHFLIDKNDQQFLRNLEIQKEKLIQLKPFNGCDESYLMHQTLSGDY